MDREAAKKQCAHLIRRRAQRQHGGGVGLLMHSGAEPSEGVRRLTFRGRAIRAAALGIAVVMCTAAGFAGARLWDGRGTAQTDLEFAHEAALDPEVREDIRRTSLGRVYFFAKTAVEALVESDADPQLTEAAQTYLQSLRMYLPESNTLSEHVQRLHDASLAPEDREAAVRKVFAHGSRSIYELGKALEGSPELRAEIAPLLARMERLFAEVSPTAETAASKGTTPGH